MKEEDMKRKEALDTTEVLYVTMLVLYTVVQSCRMARHVELQP